MISRLIQKILKFCSLLTGLVVILFQFNFLLECFERVQDELKWNSEENGEQEEEEEQK